MTEVFLTVIVLFGSVYVALSFACARGFRKTVARYAAIASARELDSLPFVSVIVPARNEEETIARTIKTIAQGDYPSDLLAIIVVDDQSTDATANVVEQLIPDHPNVVLASTDGSDFSRSGKSNAIEKGLSICSSEVVLTTDADCIVGPNWIRSMVSMLDGKTAMVAGPVLYPVGKTFLDRFQSLEFLGLVTVGAGSIGAGLPTICNSANLAYRKSVYEKTVLKRDGAASAPGMDELLIQQIPRLTDWKIAFCPDVDAAVHTHPAKTVREFLTQRVRWASMSGHFPDKRVVVVSLAIFVFYFAVVTSVGAWAFLGLNLGVVLTGIAFKVLADSIILIPAIRHFGRRQLFALLLPGQLLHAPYILLVSIRGSFGSLDWKGRSL